METVSAVLVVTNEEERIEACLRSISWMDEIVIVDGGSTDRTLEIAGKYTNRIYRRTLESFSEQKNFGLELASGDWVLSVDADEALSKELQVAICEVAKQGSPHDAFRVNRVNVIFGRRFRHGGIQNEKLVRFFRRGKARFEQPIHERLAVTGSVGDLGGDLVHHSTPSLSHYLRKLSQYTDFEARWMAEKNIRPRWYHFFLIPKLKFIRAYIFRLGFLDGFEGLLYHFLSALYYFLKFARLREIYAESDSNKNSPAKKRRCCG